MYKEQMQKFFDEALDGLRKQGCPAYSFEEGMCVYLDEQGNRCIIGQKIPEGHEAEEVTTEVRIILDKFSDLKMAWSVKDSIDIRFLTQLQNIHDNAVDLDWDEDGKEIIDIETYRAKLENGAEEFARKWNLNYRKPE